MTKLVALAASAISLFAATVSPLAAWEWRYSEQKDVITDDISKTASTRADNLKTIVFIDVFCSITEPSVMFTFNDPLAVSKNGKIGFRFSGRSGLEERPSESASRSTLSYAVVEGAAAEKFINDAIEVETFIVRASSPSGAITIDFNAPNAKPAFDKALNGCGWYKKAPDR